MRFLNSCIAATCLVHTLTIAAEAPYSGRYLGTGRACYGTLTITDKRIEWLTPFSRCGATPYRIVERDSGRVTFQLNRAAPQCHFALISLIHHAGKNMDDGWEAMGYGDERVFREHKAGNFQSNPDRMQSCYLIRDPEPSGPSDW